MANPHSYIFFTLQLDSIFESCLLPSMQLLMLVIEVFEFYTLITMTSLQFSRAQDLGYTRGMYRVPLSLQTYDSVIKVDAWFQPTPKATCGTF